MEIGDCGELYCVKNLYCLTCKNYGFVNLNTKKTNMPGVDIQCTHCGEYGQVKTFEKKKGKYPIQKTNPRCPHWDDTKITSCANTLRNTLIKYSNNIRYYCIIYENTLYGRKIEAIAITERLTVDNICDGEKAIRAKHTLWMCYE